MTPPEPLAPVPGLQIVYLDDAVIVLDKPSGLLSVPGRGADKQDCLSARVQAVYPDALVVHRLDMATSGLIVMARGPAAQRSLNRAFAEREVHKRYEAVVHAQLTTPLDTWQVIDLPIRVDWPNRPLRIIDALGQASVTRLRTLSVDTHNNTSRVELEPVTGRSHQLRVHLQAISHPILGDALYAPAEVVAKAPRLLLHACTLALTHPESGQWMEWTSAAGF
ncbi:RluA family pseudouridine synthase [Rhodoferax saidenbachensis]|uniref:Dual-specificity RNA pseudouridine synthase RluA n=1 Tax=Rhodoferax saidenbachensis TaxID=1484693 RepID=A0A1P8KCX6_9BURK|nr:pseudouridine synthase [Rhodoferax saidenbachensis]APW43796.1 RNA pseudouridine synthase [Rhodoferax saidenbachensis]